MSGLIKAWSARRIGSERVCLIDPETRGRTRGGRSKKSPSPEEEAALIMARAIEQAELLVAEAEQQADAVRLAAYEDGYEDGLRKLDEANAALEHELAELQQEADQQIAEFWRRIEPELLRLSVDIAGKIVHREIAANEDFVLSTVKAALYQLREREHLKLRLNPSDCETARQHKEDLIGAVEGIRSIEVIEDRRVDQGGCLIESPNGQLDGRIETQLKEVEKALLEASQDGSDEVAAESG